MIWLLTSVLVVALIVTSLRIGAWYLLKYDTGNQGLRPVSSRVAGPDQGTTAQ